MREYALTVALAVTVATLSLASGRTDVQSNTSQGMKWDFRYDDAGRITRIVGPGGREERFDYKLDEKQRLQQITAEASDASKVVLRFDAFGRRLGMTDGAGDVQYEYDSLARLIAVRRQEAPPLEFKYDTLDRRTSVSLGPDLSVRYAYDFLGRLEAIETPAGTISYEYKTGQRITMRTLPNGVQTAWKYGPDGRLTSISHTDRANQNLLRLSYSYRPDGLASAVEEVTPHKTHTLTFGYDKVQRLTTVSDSSGGVTEYRYDQVGNRVEVKDAGTVVGSATYDWAGRMIKHNGQECHQDASGNLTTCIGKQGPRVFGFNALNLLQSAMGKAGRVEYTYDGDGFLIGRRCEGGTTQFVPDPTAEVWCPLLVTAPDGGRTLYVWEGDRPLAEITGRTFRFFLGDHLGSVRVVVDQNGEVLTHTAYSPFGALVGSEPDEAVHPGFAGLFFDPRAGVYLTRIRGYEAEHGRFLQPDPKKWIPSGSQKTLSEHVYCGNDPINYVDRIGATPSRVLSPQDIWWQTFMDDVMRHLLDASRANVIYADWSDRTLASAGGQGTCAGWTATFFDVIGGGVGVVSHNPANEHQRMAMYGWSIFGLGQAQVMQAVGGSTAFLSGVYNAAQGHPVRAAFDTVSLTGMRLGDAADSLRSGSFVAPGGQYVFNFVRSDLMQKAATMQNISDAMRVTDAVRLNYDAWTDSGSAKARSVPDSSDMASLGVPRQVESRPFTRRDDFFPFPPDDHGGGGGAVAAIGPSPGRGGGSALDPANVGGVYLRGAGEALKDLGALTGVALDEKNGRIVLLAEGQKEVGLPPLRMDDVVTVFRSVYEYGDAPYVSIDPNPADPIGPSMLVRHDAATTNTYVGWVLFEADRVMKGYSLGFDNVTREPVASKIDGYKNLIGLGFSGSLSGGRQSIWERFWIVPAAVQRQQAVARDLTLFDVPLKIRTERMEMQNGKMVTAMANYGGGQVPKRASKQAQQFADWFTANYDRIAKEARAIPPKETGMTTPVAFYEELRRIALVTAIAESLRDRKVPMPAWMREYQVKPVPVPLQTSSITLTSTNTNSDRMVRGDQEVIRETTVVRQIYGGVTLAAADDAIRDMPSSAFATRLAPEFKKTISAAPVTAVTALPTVMSPKDGKVYQPVALPGNETRDVAACRLSETDLTVPVREGTEIRLTRYFHSFFQPTDVFGPVWTLDIPRLPEVPRATRRNADRTLYQSSYDLNSPLNTWQMTFTNLKQVPEVNGRLMVPDRECDILGIADEMDKRIGASTHEVIFRDGRRWHFDDVGHLVAQAKAPLAIMYRRNMDGRIQRIEGWYGKSQRANITLAYDQHGRLASAKGSNGAEVHYHYDAAGFLTSVQRPEGETGYVYGDGLVQAVTQAGRATRRFAYNGRGQLDREWAADGSETTYSVKTTPDGIEVTAAGKTGSEKATYDARIRPVSRVLPNGTRLDWQHNDKGSETAMTTPEGMRYTLQRLTREKRYAWRGADGSSHTVEHDAADRPVSVGRGDAKTASYSWRDDGQLAEATYEGVAVRPEYRDDGVMGSTVLTPPEKQGLRPSQWLRADYDDEGRVNKVTDSAGGEMHIQYDAKGRPKVWGAPMGSGKLEGVEVDRDADDRITKVRTSWGGVQDNRYNAKNGNLERVDVKNGTSKASLEYDQGKLSRVIQFDGGAYAIFYSANGPGKDLPREIKAPNGLAIRYAYGAENRLSSVTCGDTYELRLSYDDHGRLDGMHQIPVGTGETRQ